MTYYNLIKLAESQDRESHTGKVLTGLGLVGAGEFARRGSNNILGDEEFYRRAFDLPHTKGTNLEDLEDFKKIKNLYEKNNPGKVFSEKNIDYMKSLGKGGKKVGYGLLGLGGLLAGYGGYKNYQASKDDPINMPSDATIRRHMKASEFY